MDIPNLLTALAAAVASLALLPLALPRRARVARSAWVPAPPDQVFDTVASTAGFGRFNPFCELYPDLQIAPAGPARGVGASFSWTSRGGAGRQTIVHTVPGALVQMQLELGIRGRPLQTFTLRPEGDGTQVTWAVDADLGFNPIARIMGRFMDGKLGPAYERGLHKLADALRPPAAA